MKRKLFDNFNYLALTATISNVKKTPTGLRLTLSNLCNFDFFTTSENNEPQSYNTMAEKILPLCEGSCGGDDSGDCTISNLQKTIVHISPSDHNDITTGIGRQFQRQFQVDDVKDLNRDGKQVLELHLSGDRLAKNKLGFSTMSRRGTQTFTFISTYSSLEAVLNQLANFSTLSSAVKAADFDKKSAAQRIISGEEVYTILAPNNNAFNKLPTTILQNLLKIENKSELRHVLENHAFEGKLLLADIKKRKYLKAVNGNKFKVNVKEDGSVFVGGAKIVTLTSDVKILNVTAHVVNRVISNGSIL